MDLVHIGGYPVLEFPAANFSHVATSQTIVATIERGRNYKLSRIPGSTRPARVSCHVYTMR